MHRPEEPYVEVLRAPAAWWAVSLLLVVAVWWAIFVIGPASVAWMAGGAALALVLTALWRYGDATVAVDATGLRAGRARLLWRYVGTTVALDAGQTRSALGVEADARAYLLTRPYLSCAVKVVVDDKRDPTPYWLISTRHPTELAARLNAEVMQD